MNRKIKSNHEGHEGLTKDSRRFDSKDRQAPVVFFMLRLLGALTFRSLWLCDSVVNGLLTRQSRNRLLYPRRRWRNFTQHVGVGQILLDHSLGVKE